MNPSQSTTILRDITGNMNRQSSRVIIQENKSRSKSLCNNNNNKKNLDIKDINDINVVRKNLDINDVEYSKSKLNNYNKKV